MEQLLILINPSLQPATSISSSVGIQVSSLPGGKRKISTRGLPYPLGTGAAGSRIYVHQCCGFQVSEAEGQCDIKNNWGCLAFHCRSLVHGLGMEKYLWRCHCFLAGWQLWAQVFDIILEYKRLLRALMGRELSPRSQNLGPFKSGIERALGQWMSITFPE